MENSSVGVFLLVLGGLKMRCFYFGDLLIELYNRSYQDHSVQ